MVKIILNKGKEQSLKRFHPWVFSGAVKKIEGGEPAEGDVVEVYSYGGEYLGIRACSSNIKPHHYAMLEERLRLFNENH